MKIIDTLSQYARTKAIAKVLGVTTDTAIRQVIQSHCKEYKKTPEEVIQALEKDLKKD